MPCNQIYACLDCIHTAKRSPWLSPIVCPHCGKYMTTILECPKKRDKKEWKELRDKYVRWGWWSNRGDRGIELRIEHEKK